MAVDSQAFRHALGRFASGVTVVTMAHDGTSTGLTVSAFSSLSLTPPYILVCIDKRSSTLDVIRQSGVFNVNILGEHQVHLSNHFASKTVDKLATVPHHLGVLRAPVLEDTLAHLECRMVQEIDAGDHFIYVGEVEEAAVDETKAPLLYYHGIYGDFEAKI